MSKRGIEYAKDLKLSAVSRMLAGTTPIDIVVADILAG